MANLITFNKAQFEHLSPEEATLVKILVYRKDFQEEVLKIRKKHGIKDFEEIDPEKDVDSYMQKANPELDDDVESLLELLGYDEQVWFEFVYLLIRYNYISKPYIEDSGVSKKTLEGIEMKYSQADELFALGKNEEARELITGADHIIYSSKNALIETSYRDVEVTFTGMPSKDEMDTIMGIVKECQKTFGKKRLKPLEQFDIYNMVIEYDRQGLNDVEIFKKLRKHFKDRIKTERNIKDEKKIWSILDAPAYNPSFSTIRGWVLRAKKLGF